MSEKSDAPIAGVIGLGLMGKSIVGCLLSSGYHVVGITDDIGTSEDTLGYVEELVEQMVREHLFAGSVPAAMANFRVSDRLADVSQAEIVIESVTEDAAIKKALLREVEAHVGDDCVIASNTSAIPVSILQEDLTRPQRVLGIHWDEPAHVTRFLEIIPGAKTEQAYLERVVGWAEKWGKEPSMLRREVRGFITNRIAYAMFREACNLVDSGVCSVEDVDRSLRNDVGWWIPFAGPFRYMDLTGVDAYHRVMQDLLPDLSNNTVVPKIIDDVVKGGGVGIRNGKGFYNYTEEESREWEKSFLDFNYKIRRLVSEYDHLSK